MSIPQEKIIDLITGETVFQDYDDNQILAMENSQKELEQMLQKQNEKKQLRELAIAKLTALGLTPEEIAAL